MPCVDALVKRSQSFGMMMDSSFSLWRKVSTLYPQISHQLILRAVSGHWSMPTTTWTKSCLISYNMTLSIFSFSLCLLNQAHGNL